MLLKFTLSICTFNCKNIKSSVQEIQELCDKCDILFLQETWLSTQELALLNTLHKDFYAHGVSSMNDGNDVLTGRPHGGLCIMLKKSIGNICKVELLDDNRLLLCEIKTGRVTYGLINVYLPYDNGSNIEEYRYYLAKVDSIIREYTHAAAIGDFNGNTNSEHHRFGAELKAFCEEEHLVISDCVKAPQNTFTFYSAAHDSVAWLDHAVSSKSFHQQIESTWVDYSCVSSDHVPLFLKVNGTGDLNTQCPPTEDENGENCSRINWNKLTEEEISLYKERSASNLSQVHINHSLIQCKDTKCQDPEHIAAINTMYEQTTDALKEASLCVNSAKKKPYNEIPLWNEVCAERHQAAREAFLLWCTHNKPRFGPVYHIMKTTRSEFKLVFRECKQLKNKKDADKIAEHLLNGDTNNFWKEIRKINDKNKSASLPESIDDHVGAAEITKLWKNHFKNLLNAAPTRDQADQDNTGFQDEMIMDLITPEEVVCGIKALKCGKSPGHDKINSEHYKNANDKISVLLAMIFNAICVHGHIPDNLMKTVIIPLIKDKKGNLASKDNYRPIAIASISSKILEIVILNRYQDLLQTTANQFGFKKNLSTDMCVFTLKHIVDFYSSHSSPVYICFMDASKAFDRINHNLLFQKLLKRKVPCIIVRLLRIWYASQQFLVKWGCNYSSPFHVTNGVRQGSIISPILFNVYIDCLSKQLTKLQIGCHINSVCMNHLMYADDMVLIAPSPRALQTLMDTCNVYAKSNDLIFNQTKTKCMVIKPKVFSKLYVPVFKLAGIDIEFTDNVTYLGYILTDNMDDGSAMKKEARNIYIRGNTLIRNFKHCTKEVKVSLFKTYCSSIFCCSLWSKYTNCQLNAVCVALNKVFKCFMGKRRDYSASMLFVENCVNNVNVIRRKMIYSIKSRIEASSNFLIRSIVNSYDYTHSSLYEKWQSLLYIVI